MLVSMRKDDARLAPGVAAGFYWSGKGIGDLLPATPKAHECKGPAVCFDGLGNIVIAHATTSGLAVTKAHPLTGDILYEHLLCENMPEGMSEVGLSVLLCYYRKAHHLIVFDARDARFLVFDDEADFRFVREVRMSDYPSCLDRSFDANFELRLEVGEASHELCLFDRASQRSWFWSLTDWSLIITRKATLLGDRMWSICYDHAGLLVAFNFGTGGRKLVLTKYRASEDLVVESRRAEKYRKVDPSYVTELGDNVFLQLAMDKRGTRSFLRLRLPSTGDTSHGPHFTTEHAEGLVYEPVDSWVSNLINDPLSGRLVLWYTRRYDKKRKERPDYFFLVYQDHFAPRSGFPWTPAVRHIAPAPIRAAILTVTCLRSLVSDTPWAALPNELLFLIFGFL